MYQVPGDTIQLFNNFFCFCRVVLNTSPVVIALIFFQFLTLDGKRAYHCIPMYHVSGATIQIVEDFSLYSRSKYTSVVMVSSLF